MPIQITGAMMLQGVVSGLLAGGLYAMVALGLSLIFGVMRVINIAHGALLMLGAYTTYWLFALYGMNPFLSLLISFPLLFGVGVLLQRWFVHRVVNAPELSSLLLTFGISIFIPNLAMLAWTADYRSVEFLTGSFLLGPIAFSKPRLVTFLFALGIAGLAFLFLLKTKLGKAIRATSQHREVAQVCGINVRRIDLIAFGLGAGLAGAGGSLVSVMFSVFPEMGQIYVFKSFLVIVLGGAGNYPGAFFGGLLLGLVEGLASLLLTAQLSEVIAYILLVLVLLVRPTGLLRGRA
ncbi:MAG: branched-chain amino acid ABC transporter permease [Deltaproteobacteria bacterium]|nr:branched-chain amino acid ABC transporter permease [Deltaproteobacteria bacterium]MBI3078353.1 branched-chain amino acid ABC transporter permease [Deltaproteobacteria bacterium]